MHSNFAPPTFNMAVMSFVVAAVLLHTLCLPSVQAVGLNLFYPFGPQNGDKTMKAGDDLSSDDIKLQEEFQLYNESYRSIYVNINGHVSFDSEFPSYRVDMALPLGYYLVAPFYADVDTRATGRLYYRNTSDPDVIQRAAADIQTYFSGFQNYMPSTLFIATWDRVGYFDKKSDLTNTFQLVLVSDGKDTFALFHYLDNGMKWIQSDGKFAPTFPDIPPQAGFDGGQGGQSFLLPGSGETGAFVNGSNVNVPGVWMYHIGDTGTGNVRPADLNIEQVTVFEPKAQGGCSQADQVCNANSKCVENDRGFCCVCLKPYYGNGYECLRKGTPQTLNSRMAGTVNGVTLTDDVYMHTYVVTTDGRTYSAISRVPPSIATAMQTLNSIGGIIGWLFANPIHPKAKNGYTLTGGKFNRTARVTFKVANQEDRVVTINQVFAGHESPNSIRLDTRVDGKLPDIPLGSKVKIDDYMEDYTKIGRGRVQSTSQRTYRVNDIAHRYMWENTITFEECETGVSDDEPQTVRLSVGKHYVRHNQVEKVVRYAMTTKVGLAGGSDPCANTGKLCHKNADCLTTSDTFQCVCGSGYSGDGSSCQDVDECQLNACDINARCQNLPGSFRCQCSPGYTGNGRTCTLEVQRCGGKVCDENARCAFDAAANEHMCECNPGYQGDGQRCAVRETDCSKADICGANAQCMFDDILREYVCECQDEFSGDGYSCEAVDPGCSACDRNAKCMQSGFTNKESCECGPGYTGDGRSCSLIDTCSRCDIHAQCVFDDRINQYRCVCVRGYRGDGESCSLADCRNETGMCAPEGGLCWFNPNTNMGICRCNIGYRGDGFRCRKVGCDVYNDCDSNARCVTRADEFVCECVEGYTGSGRQCRPNTASTCDVYNDCDSNARCSPDRSNPPIYSCRCNPGYRGDGKSCEESSQTAASTCDVYNDCDSNARCSPDRSNPPIYSCRCNPGYRGDGKSCEESSQTAASKCDVYNDCDSNARCIPDRSNPPIYSCRCNPGYRGDGKSCEESSQTVSCNQVNNCDRNAACIYNPDGQSYKCVCDRGYDGDGFKCRKREVIDCRRDPRMCAREADCTQGADDAFVCVCKPGYRGNGATCSPVISEGNFLVYAQGAKLMKVSADAKPGDMGEQIAYLQGQLAVGIDVDCKDGLIYWTDVSKGVIRRSDMKGQNMEIVLNGLKSPEGVAIDFVARNLFFTDSELDIVRVAKLDGSAVKTLVDSEMVNPRAITLDISRGTVYWTDWNRNKPQIEKINMDGTDRSVLVYDDLRLPNGLAFDSFSQLLCWGDAGEKRIECVRSDGVGRRVVYDDAPYPFDITMLNNAIYWSDWKRQDIPNINQNGGNLNNPLALAVGGHGRLYGITAVRDQCPRARNSCGLNNGGCSFLCLASPNGGRTCACPDGADPRVCQ